ncbi:alkaline phosphatase PhoX [Cupriavidus basilensis]
MPSPARTACAWIRRDACGSRRIPAPARPTSTPSATTACISIAPNGQSKRFLAGPKGCEITGIAYTPDLTTCFINIQHPTGQWPDTAKPPRSSTIVVRRTDGKPMGA